MTLFKSKKPFLEVLRLILPYWHSKDKWVAWGLLASILGLSIAFVYTSVIMNAWNVQFYNALQALDYPLFIEMCIKYLGLVTLLVSMFVINNYTTSLLSFRWRRWLTSHYVRRWTQNSLHYQLKLKGNGTDNPDQRISQDLNIFAETSLRLGISLFKEIINLCSFVAILWVISGALVIPLQGMTLTIPGYMVWAVLLYSLLGTGLIFMIGKPVIHLNYEKEKYEANFRYNLIRLRERSEEIAVYKGADVEEASLHRSFADITHNFKHIIKRSIYINCFQNFYTNLSILMPIIIAAPKFFSGAITLGVLMQIRSAFAQVQDSLSILIDNYTQIAQLIATTKRIMGFSEALAAEENQLDMPKVDGIQILQSAGNTLKIENLNLSTPKGKSLLSDIRLSVSAGEKLLIMGPNGTGKSTLLRALSGLWPYGNGTLYLPRGVKIMMVPQKSYLPIDTLRNCLLYPGIDYTVTEPEIIRALNECRLGYLSDHLAENKDWGASLSLGEQQRIIFVRILLHKPDWVIMDEPTASIDKEAETAVYQALLKNLPGLTLITIGHSPSLKAFHTSVIELKCIDKEEIQQESYHLA